MGIDFFKIKFHSDVLKKKNENDACGDRELGCKCYDIMVLRGQPGTVPWRKGVVCPLGAGGCPGRVRGMRKTLG